MMPTKRSNLGRELADDLARNLQQAGKSLVWTNMPLGSVWHDNPGIADVIAIGKTYSVTVRIYEVKISRGDFLGDINRGKYLRYLECCHQFYFATPAGLVQKADLPDGCGLITHSDNKGWHVQKAARRTDCEVPVNLYLALLMKGYQDHWQKSRDLHRNDPSWWEYKGLQDAALKHGREFARDITRSQEYIAEARELQKKIDQALGPSQGGPENAIWRLRHEVDKLLGQYRYGAEIARLLSLVVRIVRGDTYRAAEELEEITESLKYENATGQNE